MSAIGFALLSLLFAAALEVSYKRYSLQTRSRGMYVAGIGVVWGVAQMCISFYTGEPLAFSAAGLGFVHLRPRGLNAGGPGTGDSKLWFKQHRLRKRTQP